MAPLYPMLTELVVCWLQTVPRSGPDAMHYQERDSDSTGMDELKHFGADAAKLAPRWVDQMAWLAMSLTLYSMHTRCVMPACIDRAPTAAASFCQYANVEQYWHEH